ncbi:hypothetical protein Tco_0855798, partial [Tanacetum coccineum]
MLSSVTAATMRVGRRVTGFRGGRRNLWDRGGRDLFPTIVARVGDHARNQGNIESQNNNAADDSLHEDDSNVNVGNDRNGCSYKDFVECKPKEFDVGMTWEDFKALMKEEYYSSNEMQKFGNGVLELRH